MPDASTLATAFIFGPFRFIPSQRILVRENRTMKLGGRAFDILDLLVRRAGEEVSKDDLMAFVWPGLFVDPHNLKVHISSLRQVLEDTFPHATYITTIVGRGYQFVAHIQTESVETAGFVNNDQPAGSSLPAPRPLVGRQRESESVADALTTSSLVSLVGPGGVGKTSLAIAVADARHGMFPDGVYFIDLSTIDDEALIAHRVATGLGVRVNSADVISEVVKHLRNRRILIVLDNCEHLLHAVATIASRLVKAKVSSRLIATSREPLGVIDENLQRIEPLAFPQRARLQSASQALAYPSVALFALRAMETADYKLIDPDAQVIAYLCEALDGLPLAIEIAAAKLDQFTPAELFNSFGQRLVELRNKGAAGPSRHETLWATLDWSYLLLSSDQSILFRVLSVFAGSFEWSDVVGMAQLMRYDAYQTTTALGGLVSKSLLSAQVDGEQIRYRYLEITRSYAAKRLLADPLAHEAHHHHAQLLLSIFKKSEVEWACVDSRIRCARYGARSGDLREALNWCFNDGGDASLGVDLAVLAIPLCNQHWPLLEQLAQVERALNHCRSVTDGSRRMAALESYRAWCMSLVGELHGGTDDAWETALSQAERSGDLVQHLSVMCGHAHSLIWTGRLEQSVEVLDSVVRLATRHGERAIFFDAECFHASAKMHLGELPGLRAKLERLAEDLTHQSPLRIAYYQLESYLGINMTLAFTTWLIGEHAHSLTMTQEMELSTGQGDQLIAHSAILAAVAIPLSMWRGDIDAMERYSTMLDDNVNGKNITFWKPIHQFYDSVIRNARGDINAVDEMRCSIDAMIRERYLLRCPMYCGVLAGVLLEKGRFADADEAVELALKLQRQTKENWCRPEILRLKAQTVLALGKHDQSREILGKARENAILIGARSLELRIVNDMAQMAITEGNYAQAVELISPLYESFGGGSETEDLRRSARLFALVSGSNRSVPISP